MSLRVRVAACVLAASLALPAVPRAAEPDSRDIVVTAPEPSAPPSARQVNAQARAVTQGGDFMHSPLARFESPLCPGVFGLPQDAAAMIVGRIRHNAELLRLPLAPDGNCAANLFVAFVPHAQEQLAEAHRQHSYLFRGLAPTERRQLLAESGPARAWTTTVMKTRDGMRASEPAPRAGDPVSAVPIVTMWQAHSKIYLPVRQDIASVLVVFDVDQVRGNTLVQLADYATMRGLARTQASGTVRDSILALFDASAATPPAGLTPFDRAYLASLYETIPNIAGAHVIGGVSRRLRRQAAEEAPQ